MLRPAQALAIRFLEEREGGARAPRSELQGQYSFRPGVSLVECTLVGREKVPLRAMISSRISMSIWRPGPSRCFGLDLLY